MQKMQNMLDINMDLIQCFANFLMKNVVNTSGVATESELMLNQQSAEELNQPIIRKFKKYYSFQCNGWSAGQADIILLQIVKSLMNSLNLQDLALKTNYLK